MDPEELRRLSAFSREEAKARRDAERAQEERKDNGIMDAEELRRLSAASRAKPEARRAAERTRKDLEDNARVAQEMPAMRSKVKRAVDEGMAEAAKGGSNSAYVVIGSFNQVFDEPKLAAAKKALEEAIPDLKRLGIKAEIRESTHDYETEVALHVDWR